MGQFSVDPANGGAFGLALVSAAGRIRFAAVNDNTSTVTLFQTPGSADDHQRQAPPRSIWARAGSFTVATSGGLPTPAKLSETGALPAA